MTDAPERIWIESRAEETAEGYGSWDCRNEYDYDLEYIRADIPTAVTVDREAIASTLSSYFNEPAGQLLSAADAILSAITPGQLVTEGPDAVQEMRDFLTEFTSHNFEEVRRFNGPSPEDELEATTEHAPIAAFQEDARVLLEAAFPKRCKGGDIDAFNGDCLWCGAPMGGTCQNTAEDTTP